MGGYKNIERGKGNSLKSPYILPQNTNKNIKFSHKLGGFCHSSEVGAMVTGECANVQD